MDHQTSSKSIRKIVSLVTLVTLLFSNTFPVVTVFGQAQNPLYEGVTITAVVPTPPLVYPDTPPINPGPINTSSLVNIALFRGVAYGESKVRLLRNGVVVNEVRANGDGSFEISSPTLSQGVYSFGIQAVDTSGRFSTLLSFSIFIQEGVMTLVEGILVPPTITSDKIEVKMGESILFFGEATPHADIRVIFFKKDSDDEEYIIKTKADNKGMWKYSLPSSILAYGEYVVKAKSIITQATSGFSSPIGFIIGDKNVTRTNNSLLFGFRKRCDLNNDNRVNIFDFSIMAFWYKRNSFPKEVDLSNDGVVNLTDLSILAYCWTG
jgi:hypothetical protein